MSAERIAERILAFRPNEGGGGDGVYLVKFIGLSIVHTAWLTADAIGNDGMVNKYRTMAKLDASTPTKQEDEHKPDPDSLDDGKEGKREQSQVHYGFLSLISLFLHCSDSSL